MLMFLSGTVQQPGIIFLTMQELFERIQELQENKVTEVSLSYLEIYNETIRDLLVLGGSKGGLMLREDANQAVSVAGLSSHHPQNVSLQELSSQGRIPDILQVQEVMDMIVRGNECRTSSPTEANATSSRSHAVLQINVSQRDKNAGINEPHTMATLSIIDLAGSERASATRNRGDRLAEGANINKSLLSLGSCINALCDPRKRNHVPYRNSKLTRLLKFSLGGNCKTVMIVCVSPSSAHFDETQNTLRYANRAKNIQTKVTRNVFNVNRHVKDYLTKISEQMAIIEDYRKREKDSESIALGKLRKQQERREAVVREGVNRLRTHFEHSQAERQERTNSMKKLRQIERRIGILNAWISSFEYMCESLEDEEPPPNLASTRKQAEGILNELEQSRSYYHQRLSKGTWQRPLDTALQMGLEQLSKTEPDLDSGQIITLEKEAELLKSNAEREMHIAVLEQEKAVDTATMQVLLRANFETYALVNQLLTMNEESAVQTAKGFLQRLLTSCSQAAHQVVKPDGSMPVVQAFPPSRTGTPKRKKNESLLGTSPDKPNLSLPVMDTARFQMSPAKASPRRRRIATPKKGVVVTPRKKSPVKRGVRWRDDTEDGQLAEWSKTPQKLDVTPAYSSSDTAPPPARSEVLPASDDSSSPIPPPPQASMDTKPPKSGRFQTGFLSRKGDGSPAAQFPNQTSSSPESSPLQEMNANKGAARLSAEGQEKTVRPAPADNSDMTSSSDSHDEEAKEVNKALRRASSVRTSGIHRAHRRRSPPTSGSPPNENAMFTASHARRMVKGERDPAHRNSVLGPHATPVMKQDAASARRTTMSGDRGLHRSGSKNAEPRFSAVGPGSANRTSMAVRPKSTWR